MHKAHVSPRYVPAELRGGEQFIRILSEHAAKDEETTVLTSNANDLRGNLGLHGDYYFKEKTATIKGVRVIRFPVMPEVSHALKRAEPMLRFLSADWRRYPPLDNIHVLGWGPFTPSMKLHIEFSNYDLVHAAIWPTTTLFVSFLACKKANIPFVITPFYHYRLKEFTHSGALRKMLPFCSAVIAVTEGERIALLKIGAHPERTFVVPLALDLSPNLENGAKFREKHDLEGKFIVFANPWMGKGIGDVLVALKKLSKEFHNLALVTFGQPDPEYLNLVSQLTPLGFTILNLGWIYGQEKFDMFAGSDLLALPSISDAFGMVYLEAWAAGKPVIGAKQTAVEFIIKDGKDGFLVEVKDVHNLALKIKQLLENPKMRIKMGENGRNRVREEFTPARMTHIFNRALKKSLELGLPY
jgi:glycosyltransferase involved in cell wall biosynthesis